MFRALSLPGFIKALGFTGAEPVLQFTTLIGLINQKLQALYIIASFMGNIISKIIKDIELVKYY